MAGKETFISTLTPLKQKGSLFEIITFLDIRYQYGPRIPDKEIKLIEQLFGKAFLSKGLIRYAMRVISNERFSFPFRRNHFIEEEAAKDGALSYVKSIINESEWDPVALMFLLVSPNMFEICEHPVSLEAKHYLIHHQPELLDIFFELKWMKGTQDFTYPFEKVLLEMDRFGLGRATRAAYLPLYYHDDRLWLSGCDYPGAKELDRIINEELERGYLNDEEFDIVLRKVLEGAAINVKKTDIYKKWLTIIA